jgi:HEAT repeat protein
VLVKVVDKRLAAERARWIWPLCVVLLTTARLPAMEDDAAKQAQTVLQAGLQETKADKRAQAVSALGFMPGDGQATETAEHELEDTDPIVRRAAIIALGDMDSKASLPKIKALLSHSDAATVVTIAAVLTKFKDPEANEIYYEVLTGKRKGGGGILDGLKDRKSLEAMGVKTAIGFLPFGGVGTGAYDYLKQGGSAKSKIDVIAIEAITHDPDPDVKEALVDVSFSGKEPVQVAAFRALAQRGDASVVEEIKPALSSDKPLIRYAAAATILHLLHVRLKQVS